MRVISVPVAYHPECAAALNIAFVLGHPVGASIIAWHVRPHSYSTVVMPSILGLSERTIEEAERQGASKPQDAMTAGTAEKSLLAQFSERHGYDLIRRPRAKPGSRLDCPILAEIHGIES